MNVGECGDCERTRLTTNAGFVVRAGRLPLARFAVVGAGGDASGTKPAACAATVSGVGVKLMRVV